MYYKQSTKNIRLVILSFDDVMFDLTKLRYNYYRRLCKLYNVSFEKNIFLNDLGSCKTMFSHCPIDPALLSVEAMVSKIEEDLLAYSKMYGLRHRDGLVELMELFRQKKIDCVVTSTHEKKYTEPLYKIAALYHRPCQIIYEDTYAYGLTDPKFYKKILEKYQLKPSEVLLIAGNRPSVLAANELRMNVIYLPDIEDSTREMEVRSLKVVSNLLEIINILLEGGHLAPLQDQYLLIRHEGNTQDLYQNYQHLRSAHREEPQLLSIIEDIYQDEYSKAQKTEFETQIELQEVKEETVEEAQVSVLDTLESALNEDDDQMISSINEALSQKKEISAAIEEPQEITKDETTEQTKAEEEEEKVNPLDALLNHDDTLTLNALEKNAVLSSKKERPVDESLMQMIDEVSQNDTSETKEPIDRTKIFTKEELKMLGIKEKDLLNDEEDEIDDDDESTDGPSLITSCIVNMGYALIDSCLLCLICGILFVGLQDWLAKKTSPLHFIYALFIKIGDISYQLFGSVISKLTTILNTSDMFDGFLAVIIFMTIVIWVILNIISVFKNKYTKNVEDLSDEY